MGNVAVLVVGFVLLVWGADRFVEGSCAFAKKLGIPAIIIGLTIVAFGTSAPELAVSLVAGLQGANEIAVGNVLGSNIFNLLVVVGASAMVSPLVIDKELLDRDWIVSIIATVVLGVLFVFCNELSRLDAVILLIGFVIVLFVQMRSVMRGKENSKGSSDENVEVEGVVQEQQISNTRTAFAIVAGLISIIVGGQLAVSGATEIARIMNISETIIGLTIVAIGTSLPELVTSVVATRRGEKSIAIGNVIGSNIFNVLLILGISGLCNPIGIQMTAVYDTILLLIISGIMYVIARKGHFNRGIGLGMIMSYIGYTIWIIVR